VAVEAQRIILKRPSATAVAAVPAILTQTALMFIIRLSVVAVAARKSRRKQDRRSASLKKVRSKKA